MDPAYLKHGIGNLPGFYQSRRGNNYTPYGNLPAFYQSRRGNNYTPYGSLPGFYQRRQGNNYIPYGGMGDFVYKPVTNAPQAEVMPSAEVEAYSGYGQDPITPGYTFGNVMVMGVIGFLIGQLSGEHLERTMTYKRKRSGQGHHGR